MWFRTFAIVAIASSATTAWSADAPSARVTAQDYERANQMLPWNMRQLIKRLDFAPNWTGAGETFMYRVETGNGAEFFLIDPPSAARKPAFDRERLAASLSQVAGKKYAPKWLPINEYYRNYHQAAAAAPRFNVSWRRDLRELTVRLPEGSFACELASSTCRAVGQRLPAALGKVRLSPNGEFAAFTRDHDLYIYDVSAGSERRLTTDGEEYYAYAKTSPGTQEVSVRRYGLTYPPVGVWSPDSTRFITHRFDQRRVQSHHIVEASPRDGGMRPRHHAYKYAIPGDPDIPQSELMIFDVRTGERVALRMAPIQNPGVASPIELNYVWWAPDSGSAFVIHYDRPQTTLRLSRADGRTGEVRNLIHETGDTPLRLNIGYGTHSITMLNGGREVVWYSERDGWAHLYLYDAVTGNLRRQITRGDWVVVSTVYVDEAARQVYFLAAGREVGRDPYYRHLYRASLDRDGIELLTPEDADHSVSMSPAGTFFTDSYSRVDRPPVTVLRRADGTQVMKLEETDISDLRARGWQPPERFRVKAADGVTDIYGLIVKPTNFNSARRYPVVDAIYPAPGQRVPNNFVAFVDSTDHPQALPELGFILVMIDGRGTHNRDRKFRDFVYRNYHDAALGDHVAGIREVAATRPYMDIERMGVYGHSNGGTNTVRAMLNHPDFYDVGVASAASSDRRMHSTSWETTVGPMTVANAEAWRLQNLARPELVARYQGKMLIVMGEVDENVHPAQAMRLMAEMIAQNKDFDFLMLPGRNHDFKPDAYFIRKRWDYFVRKLLGAEPPTGVEVVGVPYEPPPLLFRPAP